MRYFQCETLNGELATPYDRYEDDLLSELMRNKSQERMWLDGQESRVPWEDVVGMERFSTITYKNAINLHSEQPMEYVWKYLDIRREDRNCS